MSEGVQLALINQIPAIVTAIGVIVVGVFVARTKKEVTATKEEGAAAAVVQNEKLDELHKLGNSSATRADDHITRLEQAVTVAGEKQTSISDERIKALEKSNSDLLAAMSKQADSTLAAINGGHPAEPPPIGVTIENTEEDAARVRIAAGKKEKP